MNSIWRSSRFTIDLSVPQIMGIVNVTPDSFSDGGQFASERDAIAHCEQLVGEGADILDIGGESTRPGARTPSAEEELARVLPVLRHALTLGVPVSVDTSQPLVMRAALDLGVDIINDIRALQRPGALEAVAAHATAGVCLMHMQGEPDTMQAAPRYDDPVLEVAAFLAARRDAALVAGIGFDRIALDPGIGFGKSVRHNLALLARQRELVSLGSPLLIGWSRKSTLGAITGRSVDQRLCASVAAAVIALERGARIVRVHDVAATVDAVKVWCATIAQADMQVDKTT
jgi:dihydropteroate synthase